MPRFRNLTRAQEAAFERISCEWYRGTESHPSTLAALERRGLIGHEDELEYDNGRDVLIRAYFVPAPVLAEYRAWCSEQLDTSEATAE